MQEYHTGHQTSRNICSLCVLHLGQCEVLVVKFAHVAISVPRNATFVTRSVRETTNRSDVKEAVGRVWGHAVHRDSSW